MIESERVDKIWHFAIECDHRGSTYQFLIALQLFWTTCFRLYIHTYTYIYSRRTRKAPLANLQFGVQLSRRRTTKCIPKITKFLYHLGPFFKGVVQPTGGWPFFSNQTVDNSDNGQQISICCNWNVILKWSADRSIRPLLAILKWFQQLGNPIKDVQR